jgi:hypothetical protein
MNCELWMKELRLTAGPAVITELGRIRMLNVAALNSGEFRRVIARKRGKTLHRNAVAVRFVRARSHRRGSLSLGLCDPRTTTGDGPHVVFGYTRGQD